jgi:hypothetical protein
MLLALFLILVSPIVAFCAEVEFNRDVRPILSDKCFTCHGPDPANRKTKLRFDMESGAAGVIVPGDPAKSKLYQRINSENKATRMPPAYAGHDKLTQTDIDMVRQWIEQGAKWQSHWSLIAPVRAALPKVNQTDWPRNPIDNFILKRLEKEGLHPSREADRAALIRRVTLDLTGLPPSPEEVDAFLNDKSTSAYEKVVDRLLASPRYAERMAFRWMEAARYADTNGYQSDGVRDMWRWRDWVIDAFQKNMPFDQFTIEQIAGDLLPNPTLDQRIATAFHRNHRTSAEGGIVPEEFRVEYVADRAETTANVWLGLTMGCARCHDHKYDPIQQKDFYRMFAFFNSVPEKGNVYNFGNEDPLIKAPTPEQQERLNEFDRKIAAIEQQYAALHPKLEKAQRKWEKRPGIEDWNISEGLVLHEPLDGEASRFDGKRVVEVAGEKVNFNYQDPFTFAAWIKPESPKGAILSHSEDYFEGQGHGLYLIDGKLRLHVIFRWTDLGLRVETENPVKLDEHQHVMATYDGKRKASGVHIYINGQDQKLKILFDELIWPVSVKVPFRIGAAGGLRFQGAIEDVRVYNRALTPEQAAVVPLSKTIGKIAAIPPSARTKSESDKLAFCFLAKFAPKEITETRERLLKARSERDAFYATVPTVMVMADTDTPRDTFVLKRGAYDAHGEKVAPGVPGVLPPMKPEWPKNRLGLARWLVDSANPLTARVTVNRFWLMYFGTGLVKTVEDFGSQGEWPIHPELLDWLAREFIESGWNVKALQKTIVMSATYRQASNPSPELLQRDPENRLLARGPRLRLGPEMIRDQALSVSGLLVNKIGGPSVKPQQPAGLWQELTGGSGYKADTGEGLYRRSLYTYWRRTIAPPFMVNFDSPSRETCTVRETRTNTPLQALNLMNDVIFIEAARKFAERMLQEGGGDPLGYGFRIAVARAPKAGEKQVLLDMLHTFQKRYGADHQAALDFVSQGDAPQNPRFSPEELAPFAAVASLILNLDELVTKE